MVLCYECIAAVGTQPYRLHHHRARVHPRAHAPLCRHKGPSAEFDARPVPLEIKARMGPVKDLEAKQHDRPIAEVIPRPGVGMRA